MLHCPRQPPDLVAMGSIGNLAVDLAVRNQVGGFGNVGQRSDDRLPHHEHLDAGKRHGGKAKQEQVPGRIAAAVAEAGGALVGGAFKLLKIGVKPAAKRAIGLVVTPLARCRRSDLKGAPDQLLAEIYELDNFVP